MDSAIGEEHLPTLLASMQPQLQPAVLVFCTVATADDIPSAVSPICQFHEAEGITLILEQSEAERVNLPYQYRCRQITLTVHSSLAAIGLLAAVSQALAIEGISTNVVSAYYHDHIFVPDDRAEAAITCLQQLAQQAQ